MTNSLKLEQQNVFAGLGTATFTVVTAGLYTVQVQSFIPYQASGSSSDSSVTTGGSSLQIVVNLDTGGGPVAQLTIANPTPTQPIMSGSVALRCAVADVITVVLTSSAAVDNAKNSIKSTINLFTGPGS